MARSFICGAKLKCTLLVSILHANVDTAFQERLQKGRGSRICVTALGGRLVTSPSLAMPAIAVTAAGAWLHGSRGRSCGRGRRDGGEQGHVGTLLSAQVSVTLKLF